MGYLVALADLALELGQPEAAALHLALVKAVRMEKGWNVLPEDLDIEQRVRQALAQPGLTWPELPQDSKGLEARCRQIWKEGQTRGLTFYAGTVKEASEQRKFTYIQPDGGGEDVFVLVRDLPRDCQTKGCRVRYALEKTFDRKKNREAWRAVHVSRLKEAWSSAFGCGGELDYPEPQQCHPQHDAQRRQGLGGGGLFATPQAESQHKERRGIR